MKYIILVKVCFKHVLYMGCTYDCLLQPMQCRNTAPTNTCMYKIIVLEWTSSFLAITSKRETRIFFNNLKQKNIINIYNSVVKPRCAYTKQIYNALVLKNVVFTADVTFFAEHSEHSHASNVCCVVLSGVCGRGLCHDSDDAAIISRTRWNHRGLDNQSDPLRHETCNLNKTEAAFFVMQTCYLRSFTFCQKY